MEDRPTRFGQKIGKRPVFLPNFQWIQSVTIIALMLAEDLVRICDISLRGLFEKSRIGDEHERILERTIQVALISENAALQTALSSYGVESETPTQTEPIVIWPSQDLVEFYATMGVDERLGLTGRPRRPIGVIGSSRVYRILGRTVVAYPLVFDVSDFYMSSDTDSLIDNVWFSLDFLKKYFDPTQQPVFLFILREDMCKGPRLRPLLEVLSCFRRGAWRDVKIRLGRLQSFVANAIPIDLSFAQEQPEPQSNTNFFQFPFDGGSAGLSQRSNSLCSLQSGGPGTLSAEDDFTIDHEKIKIIEKVRDTGGLIDLYFDSSSFVEKAHILIKLQQINGNEFKIGENIQVGRKLNLILRQFTKQKDWPQTIVIRTVSI